MNNMKDYLWIRYSNKFDLTEQLFLFGYILKHHPKILLM